MVGTSEELKEAIPVNPHDTEATAEAIRKALTMPKREGKNRLKKLKKRVEERDLKWWRREFLEKWQGTNENPQTTSC